MKLPRMFWAGLAAFVLVGAAGLTTLAQPAHASTGGGPITTYQLEHTPSTPLAAGPSTSTWEYWCSAEYTGHFGCDFYPTVNVECSGCFGTPGMGDGWPGYTLRYSSKYLLLYNGNNGCMHIVKVSGNLDYMNIVTCNTSDKNQRWSFPNGGLEIKSSGDDACVGLFFNTITGTLEGYQMATCNASTSNQNWKWLPPNK